MIGGCAHGVDPRSCPTCAPELVARFQAIAECFSIVRALARCAHPPPHLTVLGVAFCSQCGARKSSAGPWKPIALGKRAAELDRRADLSNPWKDRS